MSIAILLTEKQRDLLLYQQYNGPDCVFNPKLDDSYNWIIEKTEADNCSDSQFYWLHLLPQIEYKALKCAILTEEQKELIDGQFYDEINKFNVTSYNNNLIITKEQYNDCINPNFLWVKALPKIDYQPPYNYVGLLTEQQKDFLQGKTISPNWYYNPIQDEDNNWVISLVEYYNSKDLMSWVKTLPLIPYKPKTTNNNG
jgi:hypothetical protein